MNPIVKNVLIVIGGLFVGSIVNMGLIMASGSIIPPPKGVDVTNLESLRASMHLFQPKHFIMPFLAHALGTLVGAFFVAKLSSEHTMKFALGIGVFFLLGGIANAFMLPAPAWFIGLDTIVAYLPMAWLGGSVAMKMGK